MQEKIIQTLQRSIIAIGKGMQRIEPSITTMSYLSNHKRQRGEEGIENNIQATSEVLSGSMTTTCFCSILPSTKLLKHTPPYKVESLKGFSIEKLVKDWYTYQLHLGRFTTDFKNDDVRRIKLAMKFGKRCLLPADLSCLNSN